MSVAVCVRRATLSKAEGERVANLTSGFNIIYT